MRALVMKDKTLRVDDVADPEPQKGQVLVRTLSCGICASDTHLLAHGDQDTLVPISHSYRYLSRLQQFGVEASLYVRKGFGHDGDAFYGYERLRLKVAEFFAYHLMGA